VVRRHHRRRHRDNTSSNTHNTLLSHTKNMRRTLRHQQLVEKPEKRKNIKFLNFEIFFRDRLRVIQV